MLTIMVEAYQLAMPVGKFLDDDISRCVYFAVVDRKPSRQMLAGGRAIVVDERRLDHRPQVGLGGAKPFRLCRHIVSIERPHQKSCRSHFLSGIADIPIRIGYRCTMRDAELLPQIQRLIPGGQSVDRDMIDAVTPMPGAYVLLIHIRTPVQFARRNIPGTSLSGWLVYVGSAYGSGGLRARLRRHFRQDKRVHWHVDELTNAAADLAALTVPDGSECEIVERLLQSGRFDPALRGFGSSDCKRCTAHLLRPRP